MTSSSNFPASAFDSEAGLNCSILTSIFISTIPRYAKTIIATSITAITIMTNAVEVNRIWALRQTLTVESVSSEFVLKVRDKTSR